MRPNFAKIDWSDFVEFFDSNLTEYGRPNFSKFNSQRCKTYVSDFEERSLSGSRRKFCVGLFAHGGKTQRLQTLWRISVNDKTDVGKAMSLLREAANLLAGDRESEGNEDTASSATLGMSCEAVVTNSNPAPSSNQDRVLQNFRTLFAGYRSNSPAASSFTKRSQTKLFPPGKRG